MSFYVEEDDYNYSGGLFQAVHQHQQDEEAFVCLNCGGTTSYHDDVTGTLCCDSCFTQSQSILPDSTELDVQEVQALAGRTRHGGMVAAARKATGPYQKRKDLREYDKSVPLPSLVVCLHGMQQVMKRGVVGLSELLGLDQRQQESVEASVRALWKSYLRAWTDGAEFYGKLHPEVRFSLRDSFLSSAHKSHVLRHLSYSIEKTLQEEMDQEPSFIAPVRSSEKIPSQPEEEPKAPKEKEKRKPQSDEESETSIPRMTSAYRQAIDSHRESYNRISSLMTAYWYGGNKGRLEAALIIAPSLRTVACMLWLAVSRAGVTMQHILDWIANGALPFQNAYKHCLNKDEQEALKFVDCSFRFPLLPPLSEMENLALKLVVACGLKSFEHLEGITRRIRQRDATGEPDTKSGTRPEFAFVTAASVPLLTKRLVQDLGFGPRTLDFSLALMGLQKESPPDRWLPAPLERARPDKLWSPAHVLAVIAVACKMTHGWETWSFSRTDDFAATPSGDTNPSNGECHVGARKSATLSKKDRFIPYNDENVRLLGNGAQLHGYLDFLEETVFRNEDEVLLPGFTKVLSSHSEQEADVTDEPDSAVGAVRPNVVIAGGHNPNQPFRMWRKQKLHDWYLRTEKTRALWAHANAIGEYVIYVDPISDEKKRGKKADPSKYSTPEPFHPHYSTLIEYMSYKTNVNTHKVQAVVRELDEEVLSIGKPREPERRRRKRSSADAKSQPVAKKVKASGEISGCEEDNLSSTIVSV